MVSKAILVFCVLALLAQTALCQCTSRAAIEAFGSGIPFGLGMPSLAPAIGFGGLAAPFACGFGAPFAFNGFAGRGALDFTPTSGGGLTVTSSSAIPPTGLSVISENVYEGILVVAGEVPFVGTTGMEGMLPTAGSGAVNHACGNGRNDMISVGATFIPAYAGTVLDSAAFGPACGAIGIAPYTGCGQGFIY